MIARIQLQLSVGQKLVLKEAKVILSLVQWIFQFNLHSFMLMPFTVSTKPASKVRVVKPRKKRGPRRPYYDEKDRQALLLMRRLRVTWSAMEDSFLLMCKVC